MNNFIKGYDCGDETVNLTGAPLCPNGIKSDLLKYLINKPDNTGVIFISCVLEYIPTEDLENVIKHLKRVAGGIDTIFIVTVSPYNLAGYFTKIYIAVLNRLSTLLQIIKILLIEFYKIILKSFK
jgi:hypothetical protein